MKKERLQSVVSRRLSAYWVDVAASLKNAWMSGLEGCSGDAAAGRGKMIGGCLFFSLYQSFVRAEALPCRSDELW
ncbi:MAG: hypothetical protein P4L42_17140 [Desulfocapsaceae bacterium]|nr:hypothetical protein [Desulfocapsaceae bacterium]